jgi:hypothetical protein
LSQYEITDILTRVLERKITYVPLDSEAFQKLLKERGYTAHFQQHVGGIVQECLNGVFSGTNDLVEKLTGQKPLEMTDYILKNRAMFS